MKSFFKFVAVVFGSLSAGFLGSVFTFTGDGSWYEAIEKPVLNPPGWVFGPVWTVLYVLMGVAAFLVWKKGLSKSGVRLALGVFVVQLVLNSLWSILFFGLENPFLALGEIMLLWGAILWTIVLFWPISRTAAVLLWPYIAWVSFAGYLNLIIVLLNG